MKWCRHRKTKVRGYWLKKPYDRIYIGCDPNDGMTRQAADRFDVFINVADSPCNTFEPSYKGQIMRWYPVNEMGRWNYSYLYWLKKVMDHYFAKGATIYLHCHAGAYRSPSAAILWLQSRGVNPTRARKLVGERGPAIYRIWKGHGNIPALKDRLFREMQKHPTWGLSGVLNAACKHVFKDPEIGGDRAMRWRSIRQHYLAVYYKPKWWLSRTKDALKDWFAGKGYFNQGCGYYYYKRKHFWTRMRGAEPLDPNETCVTYRKWSPGRQQFVLNKKWWKKRIRQIGRERERAQQQARV